jgi:glyoxylase-like metal-dependent hydrolase (beta-lactamase superfamily II)
MAPEGGTMSTATVEQVADGVLRLTRAHVNSYLISGDGGITLVDAGLPAMWPQLESALARWGATPADVDALVLTHGHFDHVGMARRVAQSGTRVHVHEKDRRLARHPYRYAHEAARLPYPFRFPAAAGVLAQMTAAGALWVRGVNADALIDPGRTLDVPGRLRPVWSPGHTEGHCAFVLEDQGLLFSGDALVTLDPYTGRHGPRVVARAATANSARAIASLEALERTDAGRILPGHGNPYAGGIAAAGAAARAAGID